MASALPVTTITPCPNGPLLVRGPFLVAGTDEEFTRRTVALCRCGVSSIKPFCDGSHKLIRFRTDEDAPEEERGDTRSVSRKERLT